MPKTSLLLIALFAALQSAWAADEVAATVNGKPVRRAAVELAVKNIQEAGGKPNEATILDELIGGEILAQAAVAAGIDKRPDFAVREEMRRKQLLGELYLREYVRANPISEEDLQAEFARFKTASGPKEYNLRNIQLATEEEARAVIAGFAKSGSFVKVAQEKSTDLKTRDSGGLVGWMTKGQLLPQVAAAVATVPKGKYTLEPVQTPSGWQVLKVDDVRDFQPNYEKMKGWLRQQLVTRLVQGHMAELRAKAAVVPVNPPAK